MIIFNKNMHSINVMIACHALINNHFMALLLSNMSDLKKNSHIWYDLVLFYFISNSNKMRNLQHEICYQFQGRPLSPLKMLPYLKRERPDLILWRCVFFLTLRILSLVKSLSADKHSSSWRRTLCFHKSF